MGNIQISIQYDGFAEKYDEIFLKYNRESIIEYFSCFDGNLKGMNVLDIGCGNGYDLAIFREMGAITYGVDSSKEMVKIAQKNNAESIVKVGCFEELPFEENSFDFVVSKWAVQTADSIDLVYKEISRVLKPDGKLIFLACHPMRQFMEKKGDVKNYFVKENVESTFFDGQVTAIEPSHTFNEYLSELFFKNFKLEMFKEGIDSSIENVNGNIYPGHFIIKAVKK